MITIELEEKERDWLVGIVKANKRELWDRVMHGNKDREKMKELIKMDEILVGKLEGVI